MKISDYLYSLSKILNHPVNKNKKTSTLIRMFFWKVNQLFFHYPAIVLIEKNIKCLCYPDSSYGSMVIYCKWPEYDVISGITSLLSEQDTYIDVGANFGDTTLVAAAHTKGRIFAFEPSVKAFPRLQENIMLNGLQSQIVCEPYVLSDTNGYVSFNDAGRSEISHISTNSTNKTNLRIKSYTLDSYAKKHNISNIKLLKIDVEGAELAVLRGAKNLLKTKKIKNIILELNDESYKYGYSPQEILTYLRSFGYSLPKLPADLTKRTFNVHAKLRS